MVTALSANLQMQCANEGTGDMHGSRGIPAVGQVLLPRKSAPGALQLDGAAAPATIQRPGDAGSAALPPLPHGVMAMRRQRKVSPGCHGAICLHQADRMPGPIFYELMRWQALLCPRADAARGQSKTSHL